MPFSSKLLQMGAAGAGEKLYVEDVFSTYLYTGNGSTQTITNNIDLSTEGGMVWQKIRSPNAYSHRINDTVRGAQKELNTNTTGAEAAASQGLTSFSSTGFSIGNLAGYNENNSTYVSWTFRKAKKFFDVVTYTGNGTQGRAISHALASSPGCVIIKSTNNSGTGYDGWYVRHRSATGLLYLNLTNAQEADFGNNITALSSTTVTVGGDCNENGETYVMYLFAHDAGGFGDAGSDSIIKCGSFTTDSAGNATINLGWEPQWVLWKKSSGAQNWYIEDNMRAFNLTGRAILFPALSNAEATGTSAYVAPNSTGFAAVNAQLDSVSDYIYIAIRRGPMKTPTSGTSVYYGLARTGTGAAATITGLGFAPDVVLTTERAKTYDNSTWLSSKLIGTSGFLRTNASVAELTGVTDGITSFGMDGVSAGIDSSWGMINYTSKDYISWFFKRAPGFFDVVCYTGTGSGPRWIDHNLTTAPEFIIVKNRSNANSWTCSMPAIGQDKVVYINLNTAASTDATMFPSAPTSTQFRVANGGGNTNANGYTYVAYLFASCPGVSKVGSYTGNGSSVTVTTDFQPRFIMVKRTDSTGDWLVSDSARGLVAGNDPYLELNTTDAEVTNEDWVDISSTSFTVNQTTNNANVNTGTYIYLAIA